MSSNDTVQKTVKVALLLCLVCSIVVSGAAVILKPIQLANKALDRKTNILAAAGFETKGQDIDALFHQFTPKVVFRRPESGGSRERSEAPESTSVS